jgi:hypothetical protein
MNRTTMMATTTNVDEGERWLSAIAGALLAIIGFGKKSPAGVLLGLVGGYLLYRGASGHCFIYELMGKSPTSTVAMLPADAEMPPSVHYGDEVMESSWESFPTSDPPSWTMGREREDTGS